MKEEIVIKRFFVILFFLILITILCPRFPYYSEQIRNEKYSSNNEFPTFKRTSIRIVISSDQEFHQKALEYSWPGNGSEFNPYIISDNFFSLGIPIRISNSRLHFKISNNTMNAPNDAIDLENVSDAKIILNTVTNAYATGIRISDCNRVQIANNLIRECNQVGIEILNSPQTCVYNNSIIDMKTGIILENSSDCFVSRNTISHSDYDGIRLTGSENCSLYANEITNSQGRGLTLFNSDDSIISDNFINITQDHGIQLQSSNTARIFKNSVQKCENGLILESCLDAEIYDNTIIENDHNGMRLFASRNCIISSNTIMNNINYGIELESCLTISIVWNDFITNNENYINSQGLSVSGLDIEFHQNFWSDLNGSSYNIGTLIDTDPRFIHSPFLWLIPSFDFLYPAGGEWLNGIIDLKWEIILNFNTNMTFSIYTSCDAGWTWTNLVSNHINEFLEWNSTSFPQTSKNIIQVLASCPEGVRKVIYSNLFIVHLDILPPRIVFPLFQDSVLGRTTIQWDAGLDPNHSGVVYSLWISKNLEDWLVIMINIVNTQYIWNSSELPDGDYYLKVVLHCPEELTAEDTLGGTFTINNHYLTPVTIINPQNGAVLHGRVKINWTASEDTLRYDVLYSLLYSDNEGNSWNKFASNLTETEYIWDTTRVKNGRNYKIMIIAETDNEIFGEGGEEVLTTLEGKFTIENIDPPPVEQILLVILTFISGFLILTVVILRKRLRSVESVLELKHLRIGICLGTFSDEGLFIRNKSDNCPYDESSLSSMLEYSAVLLQRGEFYKIYGPFPHQKDEVFNIEWYNVSYGFRVVDASIQDSRIVKSGGFTPALLLLIYPRQFDSLFMLQKREVENLLETSISNDIKLSKITKEFLDNIGDQIYKLLLGYKPIKLDEVLSKSSS
jgi:parallel beta-helix repeat protein